MSISGTLKLENIDKLLSKIETADTLCIVANQEYLGCDLEGETVILSLKNGKYYGLNAVGASIWKLIQTPIFHQDLLSAILEEYDVDEIVCITEINSFLKLLTNEGLIDEVH